ncbi:hypothetical protein, partial [Deinococcus wulumuqiensis]|uniref:hypothetical protein n=1 Tax=Deinococcus wulumuqiensis TaxID=980427 RepID=UPI001CEF9289
HMRQTNYSLVCLWFWKIKTVNIPWYHAELRMTAACASSINLEKSSLDGLLSSAKGLNFSRRKRAISALFDCILFDKLDLLEAFTTDTGLPVLKAATLYSAIGARTTKPPIPTTEAEVSMATAQTRSFLFATGAFV